MNVILIDPADHVASDRVVLTGRRFKHAHEVLGVAVGDCLAVGATNGKLGSGRVVRAEGGELELELELTREPPPPLPVTLCVAMSRPPTIRKVLRHSVALGVKDIVLFHCKRVEKSYWTSSLMKPESLEHELRLALEQAGDTMLPSITCMRRFRPFAQDFLSARATNDDRPAFVADPSAQLAMPHAVPGAFTLVIGPEGGFIPFEREVLAECHTMCSLGARVLRVEAATVAALGRMLP